MSCNKKKNPQKNGKRDKFLAEMGGLIDRRLQYAANCYADDVAD